MLSRANGSLSLQVARVILLLDSNADSKYSRLFFYSFVLLILLPLPVLSELKGYSAVIYHRASFFRITHVLFSAMMMATYL